MYRSSFWSVTPTVVELELSYHAFLAMHNDRPITIRNRWISLMLVVYAFHLSIQLHVYMYVLL